MDPTQVAQAMLGQGASPEQIQALLTAMQTSRQRFNAQLAQSRTNVQNAPPTITNDPIRGRPGFNQSPQGIREWRDQNRGAAKRTDILNFGVQSAIPMVAGASLMPSGAPDPRLALRQRPEIRYGYDRPSFGPSTSAMNRYQPRTQEMTAGIGSSVLEPPSLAELSVPSRVGSAPSLKPGHVLYDRAAGKGAILDKEALARMDANDIAMFFGDAPSPPPLATNSMRRPRPR